MKDVLSRFLQEQESAIQTDLQARYPGLSNNIPRQILDAFVTEKGTKRPIRLLQDNETLTVEAEAAPLLPLLPKGALSLALEHFQAARLIRVSDNTLELAHDALAAVIDQSRSDAQRRLNEQYERLLNHYHTFKDTGEFLTRKQLTILEEYMPLLEARLDDKILKFVQNSYTDVAQRDQSELQRKQAELEKERKLRTEIDKRRKLSNTLALTALVIALMAVTASLIAWQQYRQNRVNAGIAVDRLLKQATDAIYHLNYDKALPFLNAAVSLNQKKSDVRRALYEIAFFKLESRQNPEEALNIMTTLTVLYEIPKPVKDLNTRNPDTLSRVLRGFDPEYYDALQGRYYPFIGLVDIPGGSFWMGCASKHTAGCPGSELPRHQVQVKPFKLAPFETTFWQWGLYCAATNKDILDFSPSWGIDGDNPAVNIEWFDAIQYANWLSRRFGLDTAYVIDGRKKPINYNKGFSDTLEVTQLSDARGFRLPSEAEWEYAARGLMGKDTFKYAGSDSLSLAAWWGGNRDTLGVSRTHPVGVRLPNNLGLFDMSGNVWEWCADHWHNNYNGAPENGAPWVISQDYLWYVIRGGSYSDFDTMYHTVSARSFSNYPTIRGQSFGFRVALY